MLIITTTSAELLARTWHEQGFAEGAPAHLAPALGAADVRSYRRMTCGECGRQGQQVQPYHRGREYRLLCSCPACGHGEEA